MGNCRKEFPSAAGGMQKALVRSPWKYVAFFFGSVYKKFRDKRKVLLC